MQKYLEAKGIFLQASLHLPEWISNHADLNLKIPESERAVGMHVKMLGVIWEFSSDSFSVKVPDSVRIVSDLTKRKLLQMTAAIYDPLGFWTPVTFFAKVLLQELWREGYDWDTVVSENYLQQWEKAVEAIRPISEHKILRCIPCGSTYQLAIFTDASEKAYGAAAYLLVHSEEKTESHFLFSKMRLRPVSTKSQNKAKELTIPKLELVGALIGVRLVRFLQEQLHLSLQPPVLWTDSQCVLYWLASEKTLPVFIRNRIEEIKQLKNIEFRYVPSADNPADLLTKGLSASDLIDNKLWWNGPSWLTESMDNWPSFTPPEKSVTDLQEESPLVQVELSSSTPVLATPFGISPENFSSLMRLLRVSVYILRFLHVVSKGKKLSWLSDDFSAKKPPSASEITVAKHMWISYLQKKRFSELLDAFTTKRTTPLMHQLGAFVDSAGLIRCGDRFRQPGCVEDSKFPILLPRKEKFMELLILKIHNDVMHGRVNHTLAELRKEFWVVKGRAEVKRVLHNCILCRKFGGGPFKLPFFPSFPKDKLCEAAPFQISGVDYFGPIQVKDSNSTKKNWVSLFTCLVTRAVHLELVFDMTTEEFLFCFRRFVARRGLPQKLISDNALQFKAADSFLRTLWESLPHDSGICAYFSNKNISWHFIPEFSPWQGGFYE